MAKKKTTKKASVKPAAQPRLTAEDIVHLAKTMSNEDKTLVANALGVLSTEEYAPGQRRTVAASSDVETPVKMEIAAPPPKPKPKPGVIFKSPHMGFWQLLEGGETILLGNGNWRIKAPRYAIFEKGTYRAVEEEDIELMRAKIAKKRGRGGPVEVIEVKDERIVEALNAGGDVDTLKNKKGITADTPIAELSMTPGMTPTELAGG